jgi:NhaP-type Na+/H+ or K+/H+ antiporter
MPSHQLILKLAEFTLALVLFSDASRVGWPGLRADAGLYLRLLGGALPVTIALGTLLALALVSPGDIWLALLAGAALAPTDAALGATIMTSPAVPARVRRLINVESGLNDGIATPAVLVALAGAGDAAIGHGLAGAVAELALGLLVGTAVGGVGGLLVSVARRHGWAAEGFAGSAVLGLAVCAYASSVAAGGNGFIAAFTGGLAFGTAGGRFGEPLVPFVEEVGALASLLAWLAFGAVEVVPALQGLTWQIGLYAVLSLTLIRMLPTAVALAGAGLGRAAVALVSWFGPRGLASVTFALLALEELGRRRSGPAITAITVTVLLSVLAHGATAGPITRMNAGRLAPDAPGAGLPAVPERRLIRRASSPSPDEGTQAR